MKKYLSRRWYSIGVPRVSSKQTSPYAQFLPRFCSFDRLQENKNYKGLKKSITRSLHSSGSKALIHSSHQFRFGFRSCVRKRRLFCCLLSFSSNSINSRSNRVLWASILSPLILRNLFNKFGLFSWLVISVRALFFWFIALSSLFRSLNSRFFSLSCWFRLFSCWFSKFSRLI